MRPYTDSEEFVEETEKNKFVIHYKEITPLLLCAHNYQAQQTAAICLEKKKNKKTKWGEGKLITTKI